ncbi:MAG: hypothetical protein R3B98_04055 [Hyphomonas sp.]
MLRAYLTGFFLSLLMLGGCAVEDTPAPLPDPSHTITLTAGWEFWRGPAGETVGLKDLPTEGWQEVRLPHREPRAAHRQ